MVSCEAAVGPVGIVEAKRPAALGVTGVLDGDGARYHGDDTAAACIPFSLMEEGKSRRVRAEGRGKILFGFQGQWEEFFFRRKMKSICQQHCT